MRPAHVPGVQDGDARVRMPGSSADGEDGVGMRQGMSGGMWRDGARVCNGRGL